MLCTTFVATFQRVIGGELNFSQKLASHGNVE